MKRYLAFLALGLSAAAFAQSQGWPSFADVDTNHDGRVSREEAAQIEGLDFSTADTNHDGYLDRQEYMAAMQKAESGSSSG
jgi:hypothetical protein